MSSPAASASPTGPPAGVSASPGATGPPAGVSAAPGATGPPAGVAGGATGATGPPAGAGGATGPPAGVAAGPPPVVLSPLELTAKKIVETNKRVNIGSYLIGLGIDMILLGILLNQFAYWRSWVTEEKLWRKITVYWICLVAVASSCFGIAHLFHLFVWNYEKFVQFLPIDWFNWYPIFAMLITVPIQAYFARRAYRLNEQSFVIPLLVAILIIGEIVGCLNQKILETSAEYFQADSLNKTKPFVLLHFACNLAIQLVIFSSIIVGLLRKPNGPMEGGSNFFVKFLKMTNESLFFPTLIALLMLIWYAARPTSHFVVFWMIVYPKVSAVCFMAQVNSLIALRHKTTSEQSTNRAQDSTFVRQNRMPTDTVQVSTDIYVSETKLEGGEAQKFSVNRGPYPHPHDAPHHPSNRGDSHVLGSNDEIQEDDMDLGKNSEHGSNWSPTTWDDKRRMEVGRMV